MPMSSISKPPAPEVDHTKIIDNLEKGYHLRQDKERAIDMEAEERAMTNLVSQEYDALKMLAAIPKESDLYQFKFEQYKKLSEMRHESEVKL